MKKYILLTIGIIICCTGCNPKSGLLTCTMTSYPTDGITLQSTYKANYKDEVVTKLTTIEKVIAEEEDNLDIYKEKIEELYKDYQGLDHYKNTLKIKDNVLTSKTVINYNKIDTDKLIEASAGNRSLIKDGKVNIDDLKDMYQQNGCNCKKEG